MERELRKLIVGAAYNVNHGHIPSALSIVEIISAFDRVKEENDEFILSKGHGCLAYYAYLVKKGIITVEELNAFGKSGSKLGGHPDRNKVKGVYASTGSLGHGFPIAVGVALARKIKKQSGKIFCLLGDGECNEGSIWEALMIAVNLKLDNLVCIVDSNKSQIRSLPLQELENKFSSFGGFVLSVDGHSIDAMTEAMQKTNKDQPVVIIAHTIKGKGLSELENNMFAWHHRAPSELEYKQFIKELDEK